VSMKTLKTRIDPGCDCGKLIDRDYIEVHLLVCPASDYKENETQCLTGALWMRCEDCGKQTELKRSAFLRYMSDFIEDCNGNFTD